MIKLGRLFFILMIGGSGAAGLFRPWIGVLAAYTVVILVPQDVWWWNFSGLRPAFWILLPTLAGFGIAFLRGQYDLSIVRNGRTYAILGLWLMFTLSFHFGPYTDVGGPLRFTDPDWAMSLINKILILFLIACLCIDELKKLRLMVYALIGSGLYLMYWANDMYLSGRAYGRLPGPAGLDGSGPYADGNNFAMLFVVVWPFLWYAGLGAKTRIIRWALWIAIPFTWHAVFLTGSRGGLVGLAVTLLLIALRSKNRLLGLLLIPAFAIAYVWQAGDLMRDRASTIDDFRTEQSAASRLEAWSAARSMIGSNPIVGVGLASFGPAFPDYSSFKPREAHNTFFQISAESGLIAGFCYLYLIASSLLALWRNGRRMRRRSQEDEHWSELYWINEAVMTGFFGLVVCSLFLSLQLFEIFYFLCLLVNAILYLSKRSEESGIVQSVAAPATTANARR